MSKVRVCFMGTPGFAVTCLDALLADDHFDVVGVVTQPDRPAGRKLQLTPSPVKERALAAGLPVLTPQSLKREPEAVAAIASWRAEIGVVVAFGQILTTEFMESFRFGCVNVHASLLPRWRGAAPIQRAIEAGDHETGVALQRMVLKLDAGDVLGSRRVAIAPAMNSLELHDLLAAQGAALLRVEMMDYVRGNLAGVPQDESAVTVAKKIDKAESLLDWSAPAQALHDKVRAFVWGPGTFTMDDGARLKIHRTQVTPGQSTAPASGIPGVVSEVRADAFVVGTGAGALEILEVQPESRSRMPAADFIKSRGLKPGHRFG